MVAGALVLATVLCVRTARRSPPPRTIVRARRPSSAAPPWLAAALGRADVALAPALVLRAWGCVAVLVVVVATVIGGVPLAVLAGLGAGAGPPVGLHLARHRADRRLEADLPDALDALARSLRTGASLRQALGEVAWATDGRLGDDLRRVARELDEGVAVADALDGWRRRRSLPGVTLAATALALGADTGGASARAVDGLAQTLRTSAAIAGEVRALSSQARLSALVIACAPIGFTALAATADPRTTEFLLRTPAGLACLVIGLALDAIGALWMRHLSVVRA